ncbi:hypothetical protein ABT112_27525 [Streptomyces sp. NPDC002055]|uniref:hypothetical protein n=1 Tax=Streptomyces sp. NPDC002055 TaxID=3154534 RepID=UPI0033305279
MTVIVSAAPASAASYVDKRANPCVGCNPGIVVEYWYKKGSHSRGVGWIYAGKDNPAAGKTYYARWLYKKPGGSWKVGKSWRKGTKVHNSSESWIEVDWGRGGHTGPKFPRNTKIAIQFKGSGTKRAATLK